MPVYKAMLCDPRVSRRVLLSPVKPVTEVPTTSQPLKVLLIKGSDHPAPYQRVELLLDSLGHSYKKIIARDGMGLSPVDMACINNNEYDRIVINTNTLTSKKEAALFAQIKKMKDSKLKLPPVIAYTEGKVTDSLQEAAVEGGPVDVIVAPFGGAYSVSNYPTKETLQTALDCT